MRKYEKLSFALNRDNNGNRNGPSGSAEGLYVQALTFADPAGRLDTNGLVDQPVTFTSRYDDTVLGDTFHDRAVAPRPGNWRFVELNADSVETLGAHSLDHTYIRYAGRDPLGAFLNERGINTGLHYPLPLHLQPVYNYLGLSPGSLPEAERACREVLSLPMFPKITSDEIKAVANAIGQFFESKD